MKHKINFTKKNLDGIDLPAPGNRITYYDTKVPYLALRVSSSGRKTFIVSRKISGRSEKITLGIYPASSIEQVRKKAAEINGLIATGINPADASRKLKSEIVFLQLFNEYMERHAKLHKKSWKNDQNQYQAYLTYVFRDSEHILFT